MGTVEQVALVFVGSFVQVFFIALQTIAIQRRSLIGAAFCALNIAGFNVVVLTKVVSSMATGAEIAAYVIGNAVAVPVAMLFGDWVSKKRFF